MRDTAAFAREFDFALISMAGGRFPAAGASPIAEPDIEEFPASPRPALPEKDRDLLIEQYLPLVKQIAAKLMRSLRQCDFDDLVSDGIFGLMKAVEQFDSSRGVKFETYATPVIRGSILNGLRALDWVPERKRIKTRELQRAMDRLVALQGREATGEELAQELKITAQEVYELIADLGTAYLLSLDQPISSSADEERSFLDTIQDQSSADPSAEVEFQEQRLLLRDSLTGLPEREQLLVKLHYFEGVSFEEISRRLNVSKQRVSQLHAKVLKKLRFSLSGPEPETRAPSGSLFPDGRAVERLHLIWRKPPE